MQFFFVRDHHHRYRFFSSEPIQDIQVEFSRLKKIWEAAKQKLQLLPPKILRQEQAFGRITKIPEKQVQILYAGQAHPKKIKRKFYFFLQKQKSKHLLLLIIETLLLPISGVMALLPGPNVFFGVLALIMITHWQAFRGIQNLGKKEQSFVAAPVLLEWESSLASGKESEYPQIIQKIEQTYDLQNLKKILYK